jgi:hypothetical protein
MSLNRHGRVLIALLIIALVVIVIWLIPTGSSTRPLTSEPFTWQLGSSVTAGDVEGYMERWLTKPCSKRKSKHGREACESVLLNQKRGRRAPEVSRMIVEASLERELDPYVLAVVVAHESSFNEKVPDGKIGEQGLTQVHGLAKRRALKQGYDLTTSKGQLAAGALHLQFCQEKCGGTLVRVLAGYQAGRCGSKVSGARLRTRRVRAERARHTARLVAMTDINPTF